MFGSKKNPKTKKKSTGLIPFNKNKIVPVHSEERSSFNKLNDEELESGDYDNTFTPAVSAGGWRRKRRRK